MAPVPFQHPMRYAPVAAAGAHLVSVIYLTYAIAASLYTSYKSLGPAQDTRSRLAQRKRLIPAFLGLAVASLALATYTSAASAILSYQTWAYEHGLDQRDSFISEEELVFEPENPSKLNFTYIIRWLSDTPIYFDALEIVAEKARRFWWGQQIDLATVAFSTLLSIEGRRRKIPLTSVFLILAHLVNLSFAQNLFYLALLLTPSPLPSGNDDLELPVAPVGRSKLKKFRNVFIIPKPRNWHLNSSILVTALLLNYGSIFLLPYAADTPSFTNIVLLARASTFLPLILPEIAPASWGTVHKHPHDAYHSFTRLFQINSAASLILQGKATIAGLVYNIPNSHYHRHSALLPWDLQERSKWERSTTALGKILGSIYDHPAVKAAGWDVLGCALSLGLWAAVRATDTRNILKSAIPFYKSQREINNVIEDKRQSTPIKAEPEHEDISSEHPMTLRRSGRQTRSRLGSIASSTGPSEEGTVSPGRKRGRPRKVKQPEEEKPYEPSPSEIKDLVEGDIVPAAELDWESTALTWGLTAVSGLGSAAAGVFGGECISR
ncbi:hypothetical protein M426DRAFT_318608 [Hypoxylon sp. CI-4A]|nr:hypothetical protein M426DRAFT_318608 [Hypoxylon sp. CI-4A]